MKYAEYKALCQRNATKTRELNDAVYTKLGEIWREEAPINEVEHREWSLGMTLDGGCSWDKPQELAIIFGGFEGLEGTPRLSISYSAQDHLIRSISHWTLAQTLMLVEIRRVFEKWIRGEIDELPPSGAWRDVRALPEVLARLDQLEPEPLPA